MRPYGLRGALRQAEKGKARLFEKNARPMARARQTERVFCFFFARKQARASLKPP
jgi:hypothetical protein